jgi:NTP pyrophosphatase (non-canonical NTP hydrolase)
MDENLRARMVAIDAWFEQRQGAPLSPEFYLISLAGEVGELLNLWKKRMRGDACHPGWFMDEVACELADIRIYLEHTARKLGVDLDAATARKVEICERRWGIGQAKEPRPEGPPPAMRPAITESKMRGGGLKPPGRSPRPQVAPQGRRRA